MLYSHIIHIHMHAEHNLLNTIKTSEHSSLKKYTSHFIERVMCERELETEQRLQHIDPHSYGHKIVSFPFSSAAKPRAWEPSFSGTWSSSQHLLSNSQSEVMSAPSARCWFSRLHLFSNYLNFLSPGLYNNLTPTLLPLSVTISHSIQPLDSQGYILIFLDLMHLLFTQVHFVFWQFGRFGGQYTTTVVLIRNICF